MRENIKKIKVLNEFQEFIKEYKIASVAIAFVMGQAVNDLVKSFVNNIFMPILTPLNPDGTLGNATLNIGPISLGWGQFVSSLIYFIILSFIVFIVIKKLLPKKEENNNL